MRGRPISGKVGGFSTDVNPSFEASDTIPKLPFSLEELDAEEYQRYDREIREWWEEITENLQKLQQQALRESLVEAGFTEESLVLVNKLSKSVSLLNPFADVSLLTGAAGTDVVYDEALNTLSIPKGDTGETGATGATGASPTFSYDPNTKVLTISN